jgi:hypothetical protein
LSSCFATYLTETAPHQRGCRDTEKHGSRRGS